jgi:antitoxin component HigA of HigAB toxin-antitoxin module
MNDLRAERLQVMLSPEELAAIDDFRFKHRMPTRAAAVRELLRFGLAAAAIDASAGSKSSNFGVFGRGPDGHTQNDPDSGRS